MTLAIAIDTFAADTPAFAELATFASASGIFECSWKFSRISLPGTQARAFVIRTPVIRPFSSVKVVVEIAASPDFALVMAPALGILLLGPFWVDDRAFL